MQNYGLAVFDLDGVIVDTARFHFRAWQQIVQQHWGVAHTLAVDEQTKGVDRYACMELIARAYGLPGDEAQLRQIADEKNGLYQTLLRTELSRQNILPGIPETFALLRRHGIPVALASSSYNAPFVVERLGLSFDFCVNPGSVVHGKPAPDIYLAAAAQFGISPSLCMGIEDAASGVAAVRAAGMTCVGVGSDSLLRDAHVCVADTAGLPGAVEELLAQGVAHTWQMGFSLPFSLTTGKSDAQPTVRRMSHMAEAFAHKDEALALAAQNDPVIYTFYELGAPSNSGELAFGTTILQPGQVNGECFMTKGHFHKILDISEVYYTLQGEGLLLMETEGGDCREHALFPGQAAYVGKGYAHRMVNTGTQPLVCFFAFRADAGHDYKTIETKGFRKRVFLNNHGNAVVVFNENGTKE